MGRGQFGPVVRQFRHLFAGNSIAGVSEWQLLHRYLDRRDEVAFEAIVSRHGPMVLGVCRRVLGESGDVEDAFQATFLILARKGGTLGESDPVGHWLYGVAYRVALRARASAARRRAVERSSPPPEASKAEDPALRELGGVVDEELARLPTKYRAPVVLCYLEGLTHEEASRQLGWPLGSVKGRLARAREILKGRLSRRGVAPAGVAALVALVREARAAVPSNLLNLTLKAATAGPSAGTVPAAVASLAAGSLATMFLDKLKAAGAVLLVLGTGAAVLAYQATKGTGDAQPKAPNQPPPARVSPSSTSDVPDWVAGWPSVAAQVDDNPGSKLILGVLDKKIAMNFPTDTPLEDVKKYIEQCTIDKAAGLPNGIPIYFDPQGLQDADITMASSVAINLEGLPLRTTLRLALKQLKLAYRVEGGLLIIDSVENQESPIAIMERKATRGELTREQYKQLIEVLKFRKEVEDLTSERVDRP